MSEDWYYLRDGQQVGPMPESRLRELARTGAVSGSDYVWRVGMPEWVRAEQVPSLFEVSMAPPGPIPPASDNPFAAPRSLPAMGGYDLINQVEYAGIWARIGAGFLDGLILFIPNLLIQGAATVAALATDDPAERAFIQLGQVLAQQCIDWIYFGLLLTSESQATFGMRALGIYITDYQYRRISFARATGWYFASILSAFTCLIGYLMIAFTERKQGLHDMMAGTYVVRHRR